ncbi:hypothetical protein ABZ345_36470 [Lentzea sp. NPDC005914]
MSKRSSASWIGGAATVASADTVAYFTSTSNDGADAHAVRLNHS